MVSSVTSAEPSLEANQRTCFSATTFSEASKIAGCARNFAVASRERPPSFAVEREQARRIDVARRRLACVKLGAREDLPAGTRRASVFEEGRGAPPSASRRWRATARSARRWCRRRVVPPSARTSSARRPRRGTAPRPARTSPARTIRRADRRTGSGHDASRPRTGHRTGHRARGVPRPSPGTRRSTARRSPRAQPLHRAGELLLHRGEDREPVVGGCIRGASEVVAATANARSAASMGVT